MFIPLQRRRSRGRDTGRHSARTKPGRASGYSIWIAFCAGMFAAAAAISAAHG